ncbi:hypothetical protein EVAR_19809_1 [Eumeta japonica]|uniref:Uncharacterized protein n=1 Tax=Eumeta variegata TaxID=151549 RepID=A0A4C1URX4_EUMVA|nr:hypothetical protein EVAR_19809_1 [Eumeta japonica]
METAVDRSEYIIYMNGLHESWFLRIERADVRNDTSGYYTLYYVIVSPRRVSTSLLPGEIRPHEAISPGSRHREDDDDHQRPLTRARPARRVKVQLPRSIVDDREGGSESVREVDIIALEVEYRWGESGRCERNGNAGCGDHYCRSVYHNHDLVVVHDSTIRAMVM